MAIPGEQRHLAITLNKVTNLGNGRTLATLDENMYAGVIYGYLPAASATVEVMSADSILGEQTRRNARVDGDTYQVGHLRSGDYIIRVVFGSVVAIKKVTVPKKPPYGAAIRADLTTADAASIVRQQSNGSGFVPAGTFKTNQGNSEPLTTFRLGSATVDGWTTDPLVPPSDYRPDELRISPAIANAIVAAGGFISKDSNLPAAFRTMDKWSLEVWTYSDDEVQLNFAPADLDSWKSVASQVKDDCSFTFEAPYIRLFVDRRTWNVHALGLCP